MWFDLSEFCESASILKKLGLEKCEDLLKEFDLDRIFSVRQVRQIRQVGQVNQFHCQEGVLVKEYLLKLLEVHFQIHFQ